MAYISIQPNDFFNAVIYNGTGAEHAITVGFQPDFTWTKARWEDASNYLVDSVRGVGEELRSDGTNIELEDAQGLKSFDVNGYTLGTTSGYNNSSGTFVSWNWKAGTTSVPSGGSITPSAVSISTAAGFGMYKYGGASATSTIAHGLGAAPEIIWVKSTSHATNWQVGSTPMDSTWNNVLYFNLTHAQQNEIMYGDTAPTSTVFTLGNASESNGSGRTYIAYAWTPIKGYSAFGKYVGNNNADGPFCYTGFQPAWVMMKRYDNAENWTLYDNKRKGYNPQTYGLRPNINNEESQYGGTYPSSGIDFLSNGFKLREAGTNFNNGDYIYMAFAKFPIVSSNSIPTTAR